jgi:hypothetical protein
LPSGRGLHHREVFDTYVERVLAPGLRPGSVVVMDDLTAHTAETVTELIEGRGLRAFLYPCRLIRRISTYPKEPFLKMSRRCCDERAGTRTREAFVEAPGAALDAVTARDARSFFASTAATA